MARPRKNPVIPEWSGMPSSESSLKEIKTAIAQTHECFKTIDNERENLTDIFSDLHAKYGIPRRIFNKLAKFSYYGNAEQQFSKDAEIQDAWEAIEKVENM